MYPARCICMVGPRTSSLGGAARKENQAVVDVAGGESLITGAAQDFAEVGKDIARRVNAEDADPGLGHDARLGSLVKGGNRSSFAGMHGEQGMQIGQFQDFADNFRDIAQVEVAVAGA